MTTRRTEAVAGSTAAPFSRLQDWVLRKQAERETGDDTSQQQPQPHPQAAPAPALTQDALLEAWLSHLLESGVANDTYQRSRPSDVAPKLNGTDHDLSQALETMLPTPSVRYALIKQRIEREQAELTQWLQLMETALPNAKQREALSWMRTHRKQLRKLGQVDAMVTQQLVARTPALALFERTGQAVNQGFAQAGTTLTQAGQQAWQTLGLPPVPVVKVATAGQGVKAKLKQLQALQTLLVASSASHPDATPLGALQLDAATKALLRSCFEGVLRQLEREATEQMTQQQQASFSGKADALWGKLYQLWLSV
jgi:hypothetical protein